MIKEISNGFTLLIRGPARITLLEGQISVIGKIFDSKASLSASEDTNMDDPNVIIIPSSHCYPIFAIENATIEVYTNNEENLTLIEENSISPRWKEIKDLLIKELKKGSQSPLRIMVLGISSGKTTLIKYLANNFIKEGFKGGYLDSDLGQQIIYVPTTINIGTLENYLISSHDINSEKTEFIGVTFPKGDYKYIVSHSSKKLIDGYIARNKDADFVLIDTDGWIKNEAGIIYKNFFIETVDPDILIVFHDDTVEELQIIEEKSSNLRKERKLFLIEEDNKYFYEKDKDERRFLRQSQFSKKFEEFRKISIPLDDMKFIKTEYDNEEEIIIEREINVRELINLPYHYVIIGLMTADSELIEIGLLFTINIEKNYILLYSNLTYKQQIKIKKILLGSLRLSTKGNHQGYLYL